MNTDSETRALAVVDQMRLAWHALDRDAILALFADDAVMQSMMKEPYIGKLAIAAMLDGFFAIATKVEMEVLNRRVDGNVVVLERRDHFTARGKSGVLPAVGIFEVEGDLITSWREYYDWQTYQRQID